ncbi:unnamed protein product, partial [Gongylonema pulchrum]|uniref:NAC domain-containing protein n=1 Tax=Gongylonema pulchrum TaxID=637853 RepID=A0A183EC55_9BILA
MENAMMLAAVHDLNAMMDPADVFKTPIAKLKEPAQKAAVANKHNVELAANEITASMDQEEEDAKTATDVGLTMQTSIYSFDALNPQHEIVLVPSQYELQDLHDYRLYIPQSDGTGAAANLFDPRFFIIRPPIAAAVSQYYIDMVVYFLTRLQQSPMSSGSLSLESSESTKSGGTLHCPVLSSTLFWFFEMAKGGFPGASADAARTPDDIESLEYS